mgnify:CR=1 FL=1
MKLKDWLLKKYLPSWAVLEYGDALEAAQRRKTARCGHTSTAWSAGCGQSSRKFGSKGVTADERSRKGAV